MANREAPAPQPPAVVDTSVDEDANTLLDDVARAAFAAAVAEMSRDPEVVRESDQINALFRVADADGLG
jgi:hypothetical protein